MDAIQGSTMTCIAPSLYSLTPTTYLDALPLTPPREGCQNLPYYPYGELASECIWNLCSSYFAIPIQTGIENYLLPIAIDRTTKSCATMNFKS